MCCKHYNSELDKYVCECGKIFATYRQLFSHGAYCDKYIKEGKYLPAFTNHTHSNETKDSIRISIAKYFNKCKCKQRANYNINACKYINILNEKMHWNLQHAENGGEYECLGFYLDGYDKQLNIAFEYDERKHYVDVYNNILCEKDIKRQYKIINELGCEFWRYNEKLDLLYKVN